MSDMMQTGFDYGDLPAEKVLECESAVQAACSIENQAIIMIGEQFAKAKENLKFSRNGNGFQEWCEKRVGIQPKTAYNYINAYENRESVKNFHTFGKSALFLLTAPSTPQEVRDRADAIAEEGGDTSVKAIKQLKADYEAERQARLQAEQDRSEWETRQKESQAESNERRNKIRELERQVDLLKAEKPEPEVRIEAPSDYEATKERVASDLKRLKEQQAALVQKQVADKLKEREKELAEIDRNIKDSEEILAGLQKHIDRYSYQQRELKVHLNAIEEARKALVLLAANLEGFESVIDHDHELRLWRALSQMMRNGAEAIDFFVGDSKPALTFTR